MHGTQVITALVNLLALPAEGMRAPKHAAAAALLEYLINSRPNAELLGALPNRRAAAGQHWHGQGKAETSQGACWRLHSGGRSAAA